MVQVRYGSQSGYCMNEFLQFSDESTEDPSQPERPNWPDTDEATAIVIAENSLNLRTQPVSSATVVTRIPRGATVTVLSKGAKLGPRCAMAASPVTA